MIDGASAETGPHISSCIQSTEKNSKLVTYILCDVSKLQSFHGLFMTAKKVHKAKQCSMSRVLQKLTVTQLVKKFPNFYGT
jgi:hypothetical protein